MDPMKTWKWIALAAVALGLAPKADAHTVQEQPVAGFEFAYAEATATGWFVVLMPQDGGDEWIGAGTDDPEILVWLMTDGTMGSGGTYKSRLRDCIDVAKAGCKPNPVCWAIYSESGGTHDQPSTTSCLVICKDGSTPCPPPPASGPGKTQPVPGDGQ